MRRAYSPRKSRGGGNFLKPAIISAVREQLMTGKGIRAIADEFSISRITVGRYRKLFVLEGADLRCGCGGPAGHNGWCAVRLTQSEARQEFLKRWPRFKAPALVRPTSLDRRIVLQYPYLGAGTIRSNDLMEQINRLVPQTLPGHLRADVCQEMIADILIGELNLADAPNQVRRYVSRAYGDAFKIVSLDAPIRDTDLRLVDTIASDRPHF